MPCPTILGAPINSRLGLPHLSGQSAILDTEGAVRCFGTPVQPIFTRASTAYRADGTQVATGVPRLERGRWNATDVPSLPSGYGERGAVMVEEGTSNLTVNPVAATNTAGWSVDPGLAVSRITSETTPVGSTAFQIVQTGAGTMYQFIAGTNNATPWTMSVYIKRSDGVAISGANVQAAIKGSTGVADSYTPVGNGWYRVAKSKSDVGLNDAIGVYFAAAGTYYVTGFLTENKSFPTSFTATTRAAESLTLDVRGLLRPEEGAILQWVYVNAMAKRQVTGQYNRLIDWRVASDGLMIWHATNEANWYLSVYGEGGNTDTAFADTLTPDGWRLMGARWRGRTSEAIIDATFAAKKTNRAIGPNVPARVAIGSKYDASYCLNTLFQQPRLFTRWPSDAEVRDIVAFGPMLGV
jgi:hypothetical protein